MNAFSEKTWIPAGIAVVAIGITISATWFVAGMTGRLSRQEDRTSAAEAHMNGLDVKLDSIAQSVSEINATLRERTSDYITATDFRAWRRTFAHDNPTLMIPEWSK